MHIIAAKDKKDVGIPIELLSVGGICSCSEVMVLSWQSDGVVCHCFPLRGGHLFTGSSSTLCQVLFLVLHGVQPPSSQYQRSNQGGIGLGADSLTM